MSSLAFHFPTWEVSYDGPTEQAGQHKHPGTDAYGDTDWNPTGDLEVLSEGDDALEVDTTSARQSSASAQVGSTAIGRTAGASDPQQASPLPNVQSDAAAATACELSCNNCCTHIHIRTLPSAMGCIVDSMTSPGRPQRQVCGDVIPSEVLLLVLTGLHDLSDCCRAAQVCRHWHDVVIHSNELWFELHTIHFPAGTWPRAPHTGQPLLHLPPGLRHATSQQLSLKTTCALTHVACRFMSLRKGLEFVAEAAGALWQAAVQAASQPAAEPPSAAADEPMPAPMDTGKLILPMGSPPAPGRQPRRHLSHVDELWELGPLEEPGDASSAACGGGSGSNSSLQVEERLNAVRVHQLVAKLASADWLLLYEGVVAMMACRCDEVRHALALELSALEAGAARRQHAATSTSAAMAQPSHLGGNRCSVGAAARGGVASRRACAGVATAVAARGSKGPAEVTTSSPGNGRWQNPRVGPGADRCCNGHGGGSSGEGGSFADRFAELLRSGDEQGALALCGEGGSGGGQGDGGSSGPLGEEGVAGTGGGALPALAAGAAPGEADVRAASGGEGPIPLAGLALWRSLLGWWTVYRRWLEVLVVRCGPLGARVEAERQLAGGDMVGARAPLVPPHLLNKGLLVFREQVLLAHPLRRQLQCAALWLAARPSAAAAGNASGRLHTAMAEAAAAAAVADEELDVLLLRIRKVLTELAVADDAMSPRSCHTLDKLQRCFGRLLLKAKAKQAAGQGHHHGHAVAKGSWA